MEPEIKLSNAYISVVKKFIQFRGKNNAKIKHLEHLQNLTNV